MKAALATAVFLCVLVLGPTTASADYWHGCGSSNRPSHPWSALRAHLTSCTRAKSVANGYSSGSATIVGFACHAAPTEGVEGASISCRRGAKRVAFRFGF